MENALDWFDNSSLAPNPDKFQVMFLGTKSNTHLRLEINGSKTVYSPEVTLLCIIIDWKLQFNRHVENLCDQARRKTGALMRLRDKLDMNKKLILYNSFIKSQFGYFPIVWICHGKVAANKINIIQKRALRAIYNDFDSSFIELLKRGNHETIHQTNLKHLVVKVFKCLRKETPGIFNDIFIQIFPIIILE